jgi:4-carboxymuconolactone decarboxylase
MTSHPPSDERAWGGRLPMVEPAGLDGEQRALDGELRAGIVPWAERAGFAATTDDGRFIGPMNIYLHRPGISRGYLGWILAEQRDSVLPGAVREVVILTVAAAWDADYVVYSHTRLARAAGLADPAIDGILRGGPGDGLSEDELLAYRFAGELVETRAVRAQTYRQLTARFGETGAIDMGNLAGIYLAACALQKVFEVPAPGGG